MAVKLYRRRLIPDELIELKDDIILSHENNVLVTKWEVLHPRHDFTHGNSAYFFDDGIKVRKFLKADGSLLYWYCDIITASYSNDKNEITVIDLLADVTVDPHGIMNVLDIDELCEAREKKLIDDDRFFLSVKQLGTLITTIQAGNFHKYTDVLNIEEYDHL